MISFQLLLLSSQSDLCIKFVFDVAESTEDEEEEDEEITEIKFRTQ